LLCHILKCEPSERLSLPNEEVNPAAFDFRVYCWILDLKNDILCLDEELLGTFSFEEEWNQE
jgi:hypothetical protein